MVKIEEIVELLERLVGPNGGFVLIYEDTRNIQVRTKGRDSLLVGINQVGTQLVQEMLYAKLAKTLHGKDADLLREPHGPG